MNQKAAVSWGIAIVLAMGLVPRAQPQAAEIRLEIYPRTPGAALATKVSGTVEGRQLSLAQERVWHADSPGQWFMEADLGRFAADGPMRVELTANRGNWGRPVLRSLGRDLVVEKQGARLRFQLPGAGQYYLQAPALAHSNGTFTVLLWVDDLRQLEQSRAALKSAKALDVTARGVRSDAKLDQTKAIQSLLDQSGTVCFPAGVYRTGTLRLSSNTTVYLAPGAVLRALDREDALGPEFIAIENARNVKLCGQGTFDANSLTLRRGHNVHHVNITSSQDVTLEDLLFKESNSWAIHIRKSDRCIARNVKVLSGKDGFDPDASRDVLIDGAFIVSGDDAVAVKNRFPDAADGKTTERVTIRNTIACSMKSALKIGTETRGPIRGVTFENCDVFDGERAVVLYARDGGPIEQVVWRNLRLFMMDWPKEKESGAVFHLNIERRERPTPVRDCLIENVAANWIYRSAFAGLPDAPLDGVTLRNITVKVDKPKSGKPCLFEARGNVHLPIDRLTIDWQGNEAQWVGVVSGAGVQISEARSATGPEALPVKGTEK
jgi:Glycosyl hydrolases family 28